MKNLFLILPLLLAACGAPDFPDYTELRKLRILSIELDQPEVSPGQSVQISMVVSDLTGTGQNLSLSVQACLDPGTTQGKDPSCGGSREEVTVLSAAPLTPAPSGSDAFTRKYSGLATVAIPLTLSNGDAFFKNRLPSDRYNGVPFLITFELTSQSGEKVQAFKKVFVSDPLKPRKNQNPIIQEVQVAGTAVTDLIPFPTPNTEVTLKLVPDTNSKETFSIMNRQGELRDQIETLTTTWFYTDGKTNRFRTLDDTLLNWNPEAPPADRRAVIVTVIRDGRGGESSQILLSP